MSIKEINIPCSLKIEMMDRFIASGERYINQRGNFTCKAIMHLFLASCDKEHEKMFFDEAITEIKRLNLNSNNIELLRVYATSVSEKNFVGGRKAVSFNRDPDAQLVVNMGHWASKMIGGKSSLRDGVYRKYRTILKSLVLEKKEERKEETRKRNEQKKLEVEKHKRLQSVKNTCYAYFKNLSIIECGNKEGFAIDIGRYITNGEIFIRIQTLGPYKGDGKMSRRWAGLPIKIDKLDSLIEELKSIKANLRSIKNSI